MVLQEVRPPVEAHGVADRAGAQKLWIIACLAPACLVVSTIDNYILIPHTAVSTGLVSTTHLEQNTRAFRSLHVIVLGRIPLVRTYSVLAVL